LKPPVRILVTSACPQELPSLDLESEIKGIYESYKKHRSVTIFKYYDKASLQDLREILHGAALIGQPFHVWHHCGHGGLTRATDPTGVDEFRLCLERNRHVENASVASILRILRKCEDLRVVVLNVCSGASEVGLAPELARINVPSVLSFSSPIGDDRARTFALALHHGLLTLPIEIAADIARESVFSRRRDNGSLIERSQRILRKKPRLTEIYKDIIEKSRQASK
jgi:hypothetical protein